MTATHARPDPAPAGGLRWLPLLAAIAIMLGITAWPHALAGPSGAADHWAAMALFWATLIFMPIIVAYTSWAYSVMAGKVTAAYIRENEHSAY